MSSFVEAGRDERRLKPWVWLKLMAALLIMIGFGVALQQSTDAFARAESACRRSVDILADSPERQQCLQSETAKRPISVAFPWLASGILLMAAGIFVRQRFESRSIAISGGDTC